MSKPEDKTFNSLRIICDKKASMNQGSICTNGGLYVGKNIQAQEIVTDDIVIKKNLKIANSVSIGGNLLCPSFFITDQDTIKFKKNLVPVISNNVINVCLGTFEEPWEKCYVNDIKSCNIDSKNLLIGNSILCVNDAVNICGETNLIDPCTNTVSFKYCQNKLNAYSPIYTTWKSFFVTNFCYKPDEILCINSSTIFMETEGCDFLKLQFNCDLVPINTKIKIYFVMNNESIKIQYDLNLMYKSKEFIFKSKKRAKTIKFFCIIGNIILLN